MELASDELVEKLFIKVAKSKGYKSGVQIVPNNIFKTSDSIYKLRDTPYYYDSLYGWLWFGGDIIYGGSWSEIISPSVIDKPVKTNKDLNKLINDKATELLNLLIFNDIDGYQNTLEKLISDYKPIFYTTDNQPVWLGDIYYILYDNKFIEIDCDSDTKIDVDFDITFLTYEACEKYISDNKMINKSELIQKIREYEEQGVGYNEIIKLIENL